MSTNLLVDHSTIRAGKPILINRTTSKNDGPYYAALLPLLRHYYHYTDKLYLRHSYTLSLAHSNPLSLAHALTLSLRIYVSLSLSRVACLEINGRHACVVRTDHTVAAARYSACILET
jgi:hypothetical protein